MDKRKGRFVLDGKKTMRIGTEIYTEIVEKMLHVHIAYMERKMKACVQCPPKCAAVTSRLRRNPYTAQYKGKPFMPQNMLPTYLLQKLDSARARLRGRGRTSGRVPLPADTEREIRRLAEAAERDLARAGGDAEEAVRGRRRAQDRARLGRLWDMGAATRAWARPPPAPAVPVEELAGDARIEIPDVGTRDGAATSAAQAVVDAVAELRQDPQDPGLRFTVVDQPYYCPQDPGPRLPVHMPRMAALPAPDVQPEVEPDVHVDEEQKAETAGEDATPADATSEAAELEAEERRVEAEEEEAGPSADPSEVAATKRDLGIPETPVVGTGRAVVDIGTPINPLDIRDAEPRHPGRLERVLAAQVVAAEDRLAAAPQDPSPTPSVISSPEREEAITEIGSDVESDMEDLTGDPEAADDKRKALAEFLATHVHDEHNDQASRRRNLNLWQKQYTEFWKSSADAFNNEDDGENNYGHVPEWARDSLYGKGTSKLRKKLILPIVKHHTKENLQSVEAWQEKIMGILQRPEFNDLFGEEEGDEEAPEFAQPTGPGRASLSGLSAPQLKTLTSLYPKWRSYLASEQGKRSARNRSALQWEGVSVEHMKRIANIGAGGAASFYDAATKDGTLKVVPPEANVNSDDGFQDYANEAQPDIQAGTRRMWDVPKELMHLIPDMGPFERLIPVSVIKKRTGKSAQNFAPIWDTVMAPIYEGGSSLQMGVELHAICWVDDLKTLVSIPVSQLDVPTPKQLKSKSNITTWASADEDQDDAAGDDDYNPAQSPSRARGPRQQQREEKTQLSDK